MHCRLLVLIDRESAKTSKEARQEVFQRLHDDGFAGEGTRFSSPIADWFVIGGRWSGVLTRCRLDQAKVKQFEEGFGKKHGWWIGGEKRITEETRRTQAKKLFAKYFPNFKGIFPYWRDTYKDIGYEDDAMIVTQEIWDKVIKDCDRDVNPEYHDGSAVIDLDNYEDVKESIIGKKWVVVVDFHW